MFHHVKELQFDAIAYKPDEQFKKLIIEQFEGIDGAISLTIT